MMLMFIAVSVFGWILDVYILYNINLCLLISNVYLIYPIQICHGNIEEGWTGCVDSGERRASEKFTTGMKLIYTLKALMELLNGIVKWPPHLAIPSATSRCIPYTSFIPHTREFFQREPKSRIENSKIVICLGTIVTCTCSSILLLYD